MIQLAVVNLYTKFEVSILKGCGEYTKFEVSILKGCGDIFNEKSGETKKKNKYREEQIGEDPFSIPRYNLLL